jgi:hypothetical protein
MIFEAIANWVTYHVLKLPLQTHLAESIHFFVQDITKLFFLLLTVIYIMGLFRSFVAPEKVRAIVRGRSKFVARLLAIGLGAVTPFCSCSSVPLFIGFVEAGIPLGVTFSFLIASPMINEIAVVMLWGILGWKMTLLYVVAGLAVAFLGGVLMERFKPERWVEEDVWHIKMGVSQAIDKDHHSLIARHRYASAQVRTIVGRIWPWVLLGVACGALFHGYFPEDWLTKLTNYHHIFAVPLAVLVGVPLYSNAVGVIPLAEAMLFKGVPVGTTLAFMMSVAALSVPELLILKRVIKWPALALFVLIVSCSIILVGWFFNSVV